ncbi:MAG TPA: ABC transporter ATP-binding protein [Clostridiales bacterium]|jgi:NitT/TauT family transport system ATP-binding protein|nr:ABC transporter ATP-binding protein [Clostridiales bacterium]
MDIKVVQLNKKFGEKLVLNNLNLTFKKGQIYCLMGASGIGKTTLLNILMGFEQQDSGELMGLKGKQIAAVFQEDRLIEHYDAIKNIKLVCGKNISENEIIHELEAVGLKDVLEKPVSLFSGGMRRRVAIVRAVLAESDLILMDEPFKGLDQDLKLRVIQYVKQKIEGKTMILVTHDRREADLLAAKVFEL